MMFKSSLEYEIAVVKTLIAIRDEKPLLLLEDEMGKTDYNDILKYVCDNKLVAPVGRNAGSTMDGVYHPDFASAPRLTKAPKIGFNV